MTQSPIHDVETFEDDCYSGLSHECLEDEEDIEVCQMCFADHCGKHQVSLVSAVYIFVLECFSIYYEQDLKWLYFAKLCQEY